MEPGNLLLLLKFAESIQAKSKTENDSRIKASLEEDLCKIKTEIGRIALELPADTQIFQPFEYSQLLDNPFLCTNRSHFSEHNDAVFGSNKNEIEQISQISIAQNDISETVDLNEFDSETQANPYSFGENSTIELSNNEIAARFDIFMKQKSSKKDKETKTYKKSKIPKPTLKQK